MATTLLRRLGFRRLILASSAGSALAIGACGALTPATPHVALMALLVTAGVTRSLLFTAVNTLSFADVPIAERASASTLSAVSMQTSNALGVALGALTLAMTTVVRSDSALVLANFQTTFVTVGAICAITTLLFLRLPAEAGRDMTGTPGRA